jgi:signal transduction histidine kinase
MQLQLLGDDIEDASGSRLAPIMDEVRRLELIVSSSLQLGHPEKLDRRRLDLNGLVREVLRLTEPQFQHRRIDILERLQEELPPVLLDGDRVKQILLNLLTNAMDELGSGGTVRITTATEDDGFVALVVEDSGGGVPLSQREGLFEQSESTKSTGFGLGLRVTAELVEAHGGSIAVADSDLGGARFLIRFPLQD